MKQKINVDLYHWDHGNLTANGYWIYIRLYIDRHYYYRRTNYCVHLHQWDEDRQEIKDKPNSKTFNAALRKEVAELDFKIAQTQASGERIGRQILKDRKVSFNDFCKAVRGENGITTTQVNNINDYLKREPSLHEINNDFLRKYTLYMREVKKYKVNSINNAHKYLRRILGQAKIEKIISFDPFKDGGFSAEKYIQPEVTWLLEEEKQKFVDLLFCSRVVLEPDHYQVLCYFLLGCFTGLRHSDWQLFDPIERLEKRDGRTYLRIRAKKNGEWVVMPMGKTIISVVECIKKVGPLTLSNEDTNTAIRLINKNHIKIDKYLTTHVGRHTFGYTCATIGFSPILTSRLMGIGTKAVEVYFHLTGMNVTKQAAALEEI